MTEKQNVPTWDELLVLMNDAQSHPLDTAWAIYRYMHTNLKQLTSQEARTLLASYMKIPIQHPSLLHSCMLTIAINMAEQYSDFRFASFLNLWGYPSNLRPEDSQRQNGKDGRHYLSLKEKAERALQKYMLHNADERTDGNAANIRQAVATRVFAKENNWHRTNYVRLACNDGSEFLAVTQLFPCKPWEIHGQVFDILIKYSKEGKPNIIEIAASEKNVADLFPAITGYVSYIDEAHGHYHVFDGQSRHFVAEKPKTKINTGDFVCFSPIIPKENKFKSAIINKTMSLTEGMNSFRSRHAKVTYADEEKGYAAWELIKGNDTESEIPPIKEIGTESPSYTKGYISLNTLNMTKKLLPAIGDTINIIVFLKRGKDGIKRPYVPYYEKLLTS